MKLANTVSRGNKELAEFLASQASLLLMDLASLPASTLRYVNIFVPSKSSLKILPGAANMQNDLDETLCMFLDCFC
jgi:hypothetical protein